MVVYLLSFNISAIQISFEDKTYQYSLRCCNLTHCVNLYQVENISSRYTELNPDYCYEIGGLEQDYISLTIFYIPIIVFILLIIILIVRIIRRERREK